LGYVNSTAFDVRESWHIKKFKGKPETKNYLTLGSRIPNKPPSRLYESSSSHSGEYEDGSLWDTAPCNLALMMEAVRTSEASFYSNESTPRNIPEGSKLRPID
jgi:hypothetical protein